MRASRLILMFGASLFSLAMFLVFANAPAWGAEVAEKKEAAEKKETAEPKEAFNLILPFQDLTVGQGQEDTMDAEVVNRTKNPVQVNLSIEAVPKGWEVGFHS